MEKREHGEAQRQDVILYKDEINKEKSYPEFHRVMHRVPRSGDGVKVHAKGAKKRERAQRRVFRINIKSSDLGLFIRIR